MANYLLFVAAEEVGLVVRPRVVRPRGEAEQVLVPWTTAAAVHQTVGETNARKILPAIHALGRAVGRGVQPVVLIRGYDWWEYGSEAYRVLTELQSAGDSAPVVIVADRHVSLESEMSRIFVTLDFPRPSGSVLFERILAMRPDIQTDAAVELAKKLPPCSWREAVDAMRMCELRHGLIDGRAVEFMESTRAMLFASMDTATYTSASRLMDPRHFGMPPHLRKDVAKWVAHSTAAQSGSGLSKGPQRLLITGASGWGKTTLAEVLAKLCDRPLIRLDAAACLRGGLGQSERAVRNALGMLQNLRRVMVLLDNVDRLFTQVPANDRTSVAATLGRVAGTILTWLDNLPTSTTVVLTAANPEFLTAPWRRRMDLELSVNPAGGADIDYRAEIFAATFHRFGLGPLADSDYELVRELAVRTNPTIAGYTVALPLSRSEFGIAAKLQRVPLYTPADIQWWIQENLLFSSGRQPAPEEREFWIEALA